MCGARPPNETKTNAHPNILPLVVVIRYPLPLRFLTPFYQYSLELIRADRPGTPRLYVTIRRIPINPYEVLQPASVILQIKLKQIRLGAAAVQAAQAAGGGVPRSGSGPGPRPGAGERVMGLARLVSNVELCVICKRAVMFSGGPLS